MRDLAVAILVVSMGGIVAGCDDQPLTSFEGNETGTTTMSDGGSGGALLTSTAGEGGAQGCNGTCVSGKPAWFDGLSLFWIGPPEEAPSCSALGLAEGSVGYADPSAVPAECPSCSCSPAACELPGEMHASAAKCPGDGAAAISFDAPAAWEGNCTAEGAIAGGLLCSGVACVQSVSIAAPSLAPCVPKMEGQPMIPAQAWGTVARECVIWPVSGEGCATGQACVPVPSDNYAVCVYRRGDHTSDAGFSCPEQYPRSLVAYTSYVDTRTCAECTCGDPEGGECTAFVSVYKDGGCGAVLGSITLPSSEAGCFDVPSGSVLGSKSASLIVDQPGNCAASGGGPIGTLEPADPVTLCCQPGPEMTP